jgi:hypothetical protein
MLCAAGSRLMMTAPRRWNVLGSGLLCGILALVVLYTNRGAFRSPIALVVLAAVGLLAAILQLRLRRREATAPPLPLWLNVLGILTALGALFEDWRGQPSMLGQVLALVAVSSFSISTMLVLHALRNSRRAPRS